jgi:phosphate uptake regulator
MNQITKYNPPPNPAKLTDSRCRSYVQQHGGQSWELDALKPKVLTNLIQKHVDEHTDQDLRLAKIHHQEADRQRLLAVKDKWTDLEL